MRPKHAGTIPPALLCATARVLTRNLDCETTMDSLTAAASLLELSRPSVVQASPLSASHAAQSSSCDARRIPIPNHSASA